MIEHKSLDFLGYANYKVDSEGNIYRNRLFRCKLSEDEVNEIINSIDSVKNITNKFKITKRQVYTLKKNNSYWVKMKATKNNNGYQITLHNNYQKQRYYLHRLILLAFVGPCPENMEGCHNDGNPYHNDVKNLRWDTPKNNQADRIKHGTDNRGENCGHHKLKSKDIPIIRKLIQYISEYQIAKIYNIKRSTISDIVNYRTWKYV